MNLLNISLNSKKKRTFLNLKKKSGPPIKINTFCIYKHIKKWLYAAIYQNEQILIKNCYFFQFSLMIKNQILIIFI